MWPATSNTRPGAGVAITGFPPTTGPSLVSMVASSHAPYAQQLLSAAATNLLSSVAADVAVRLGHSDVQDMRADRPGPASLPSSVLPSSHGADSTATTTTTRTSYRPGRASAVTYEAGRSFPVIATCSASRCYSPGVAEAWARRLRYETSDPATNFTKTRFVTSR